MHGGVLKYPRCDYAPWIAHVTCCQAENLVLCVAAWGEIDGHVSLDMPCFAGMVDATHETEDDRGRNLLRVLNSSSDRGRVAIQTDDAGQRLASLFEVLLLHVFL
jgi:hypothetical protein